MSGSSVMHMALSSSPFLVLFSYFIYVAHQRPTVLLEALNQKADVTILPLIDMLHTNLLTLICWACLAVYTGLFVRKRRNLMRLYTDEDNVITIIGDVYHEQQRNVCCKLIGRMSYTNLAYVTYKHPEGNFEDGRPRYIQKKIRTYHPYHRENVAILVMKDKPLSGQPKADVERDVASFQSEYAIRNRDKLNQVVIVCLCWIIFCLSSALYMIHQIRVVNNLNIQNAEDEEDLDLAWQYFWVYIGLVVPVVAVGGNILQWILHYRWVIHGGEVTDVLTKHLVPRTLGADENGDYTAMA